jgi:hypothetical protein
MFIGTSCLLGGVIILISALQHELDSKEAQKSTISIEVT